LVKNKTEKAQEKRISLQYLEEASVLHFFVSKSVTGKETPRGANG
jgi:hypothetical protein